MKDKSRHSSEKVWGYTQKAPLLEVQPGAPKNQALLLRPNIKNLDEEDEAPADDEQQKASESNRRAARANKGARGAVEELEGSQLPAPQQTKASKRERMEALRRNSKLLKNPYLQELEQEAAGVPMEKIFKKTLKNVYDRREEQAEEVEELTYNRRQLTRAQKKDQQVRERKAARQERLDDFTDFNDIKGIFGKRESKGYGEGRGRIKKRFQGRK